MKTTLPATIRTVDEANIFLTELYNNGESFHPNDDATALVGDSFTLKEGLHLNQLMSDIYDLPGNDGDLANLAFDPCEFLLNLDPECVKRMNEDINQLNN